MGAAVLEPPADVLVTYTMFDDVFPRDKVERADVPWCDLVGRILNAATYLDKVHCPLISLAEYGDERTDKGCIRHADNIRRIFGIELDYDGEAVQIHDAAAMLQRAGVEAVLYTSPSHTPAKPRWRVLMPLSEPAEPGKRAEYVGRANRILGGIASRESFTLSQSFYIGRVRGSVYDTAVTTGRFIDMASDLAPLYNTGKSGLSDSPRDMTTDDQLRDAFNRGEDRYQAMLKLSSRWAARGMAADDIVAALEALFAGGPSINGDGVDLRTRIVPMAESAVRKFGETRAPMPPLRTQPRPVPLGVDPETGEVYPGGRLIEVPEVEPGVPGEVIMAAPWSHPGRIPPRKWLGAGHHLMRGMVSATAGIGGAGKSSLAMLDALCLATGRHLHAPEGTPPIETIFNHGALRVWLHNAEDPIDELNRRIDALCRQYDITAEDIGDRLIVTSGRELPLCLAEMLPAAGIVLREESFRSVQNFIARNRIAAWIPDPFVGLHRLPENDNGAIDVLMTGLRQLAHQTGCAIDVVHHVRKATAGAEPSVDDLRGAGSLVAACRSVRLILSMAKDEAEKYDIPDHERRRYVYAMNGKSNMQPPAKSRRWFELRGVNLGNGETDADGVEWPEDSVGVPVPWCPPEHQLAPTSVEISRVARAIADQANPVATLRRNVRSKGWAGEVIAAALDLNLAADGVRAQVSGLVEKWIVAGRLEVVSERDNRQARVVEVLRWKEVEK